MNRLLPVLILAVLLLLGWQGYLYWESSRAEREVAVVTPSSLAGLPHHLQASLEQAEKQGAKGLRSWLRQYRSQVRDPRLAWIQLDYVVLVAKEDTSEAKKVFAEVRGRLTPESPVYPRMKELEPTYWQTP